MNAKDRVNEAAMQILYGGLIKAEINQLPTVDQVSAIIERETKFTELSDAVRCLLLHHRLAHPKCGEMTDTLQERIDRCKAALKGGAL